MATATRCALVIDDCARQDAQGRRAPAGRSSPRSAPGGRRRRSSRSCKVDYYGTEVPLQQLAGFSVPEPACSSISPYDKGAIKAIEKAIQQSDLGINPSNDGAGHPAHVPGAHRGAPQGAREGRARPGRGGPGGGAQRPPPRPPGARSAREGRRDLARTTSTGSRRSSRSSPTRSSPRSTRCSSTRSRSCSRSDPPPQARAALTGGPVSRRRRPAGRRSGLAWVTGDVPEDRRAPNFYDDDSQPERVRPPRVCGSSVRRRGPGRPSTTAPTAPEPDEPPRRRSRPAPPDDVQPACRLPASPADRTSRDERRPGDAAVTRRPTPPAEPPPSAEPSRRAPMPLPALDRAADRRGADDLRRRQPATSEMTSSTLGNRHRRRRRVPRRGLRLGRGRLRRRPARRDDRDWARSSTLADVDEDDEFADSVASPSATPRAVEADEQPAARARDRAAAGRAGAVAAPARSRTRPTRRTSPTRRARRRPPTSRPRHHRRSSSRSLVLVCFTLGRAGTAVLVTVIVGAAALELSEALPPRRASTPRRCSCSLGVACRSWASPTTTGTRVPAGRRRSSSCSRCSGTWSRFTRAPDGQRRDHDLRCSRTSAASAASPACCSRRPTASASSRRRAVRDRVRRVGYFVGSQFGHTPHRAADLAEQDHRRPGRRAWSRRSCRGGDRRHRSRPWNDVGNGLRARPRWSRSARSSATCASRCSSATSASRTSGRSCPGHGGVLDRFDAMLFCLPIAYYLALQFKIF